MKIKILASAAIDTLKVFWYYPSNWQADRYARYPAA
jgi:hypothetical protein